jgi:large subunit ribosomal protein L10
MPKTRSQKTEIIKKLDADIAKMKSAVMFNFSGIPVKEINKLRNSCRQEGLDYLVAKKTLLKRALAANGFAGVTDKNFEGEIAALFSFDDEVAPARVVATFAKENNKAKFVGGIFQGEFIDTQKVIELSKIPSRKELLAKLVGCLSNPLAGLARVLDAIRESKEKITV